MYRGMIMELDIDQIYAVMDLARILAAVERHIPKEDRKVAVEALKTLDPDVDTEGLEETDG